MKRLTTLLAALVIAAAAFSTATAQTLYWDTNNTSGGATDDGGGNAPGTWGTDNFWSTDSTGASATGAWASGATAVFSAGTSPDPGIASGTYNVGVVSGTTQNAGGITLEEGNVT